MGSSSAILADNPLGVTSILAEGFPCCIIDRVTPMLLSVFIVIYGIIEEGLNLLANHSSKSGKCLFVTLKGPHLSV